MANKPPDGIFLWDVGLGLEQKKLIMPQKPTVHPNTYDTTVAHAPQT